MIKEPTNCTNCTRGARSRRWWGLYMYHMVASLEASARTLVVLDVDG